MYTDIPYNINWRLSMLIIACLTIESVSLENHDKAKNYLRKGCTAEKKMLKSVSKCQQAKYVKARKSSDREVQTENRYRWYSIFTRHFILNDVSTTLDTLSNHWNRNTSVSCSRASSVTVPGMEVWYETVRGLFISIILKSLSFSIKRQSAVR